jgi:hypothetical protein
MSLSSGEDVSNTKSPSNNKNGVDNARDEYAFDEEHDKGYDADDEFSDAEE